MCSIMGWFAMGTIGLGRLQVIVTQPDTLAPRATSRRIGEPERRGRCCRSFSRRLGGSIGQHKRVSDQSWSFTGEVNASDLKECRLLGRSAGGGGALNGRACPWWGELRGNDVHCGKANPLKLVTLWLQFVRILLEKHARDDKSRKARWLNWVLQWKTIDNIGLNCIFPLRKKVVVGDGFEPSKA